HDEIRRIIREEEPPRPSARLSELGRIRPRPAASGTSPAEWPSSLESVSELRQTEPAKLTKLMRGELDWIVMKALEQDRNRGYQPASGLGRDVEHYLRDEPVLACPPSSSYRLRKFAWRNKGTIAAASAVAVLLLLTVVSLAVSNTWIR